MKIIRNTILLIALSISMFCKDKSDASKTGSNIFCKGKVVETMNSNGYTYVLVKTDFDKLIWAAAPQMNVTVGENVTLPNGAIMENFTSKTLGKTFAHILFVSGILTENANPHEGLSHSEAGKTYCPPKETASTPETGTIVKAKGGYTVSECYSKSAQLEGKTIVVRGKVVKFSENIMGKNWIHLRDGSGNDQTNDITITTTDRAAVGKVVLVSGKLAKNRDPGAGYHYPVIIEEARVKAE